MKHCDECFGTDAVAYVADFERNICRECAGMCNACGKTTPDPDCTADVGLVCRACYDSGAGDES